MFKVPKQAYSSFWKAGSNGNYSFEESSSKSISKSEFFASLGETDWISKCSIVELVLDYLKYNLLIQV